MACDRPRSWPISPSAPGLTGQDAVPPRTPAYQGKPGPPRPRRPGVHKAAGTTEGEGCPRICGTDRQTVARTDGSPREPIVSGQRRCGRRLYPSRRSSDGTALPGQDPPQAGHRSPVSSCHYCSCRHLRRPPRSLLRPPPGHAEVRPSNGRPPGVGRRLLPIPPELVATVWLQV